MSEVTRPVQATSGDMLRSIFVNPVPACGYFSAGVAFDGNELLISCVFSNVITRVSPVDGRNLGSLTIDGISASEGITAMSWDAQNGRLWVGSATVVPQKIYTVALDKVRQRGTATFRFAHTQGRGESWVDGLAFDPTDGTVWMGPDGQTQIYHYTQAGTLLGSFSVASWIGAPGKSGIVVGSPTKLYVANDGGSQIFSVNKDGTSPALFANMPAGKRVEDLECDNVTFAPKSVIWSKYSFDNYELNAFEVPAGECFPEDRGKIIDVPYFDQRAEPWGSKEYDSASGWAGADVPDLCPGDRATCIARWGCALSSVAMVLRYYQIDRLPNCSENKCPQLAGFEINPKTLNAWLTNEPGGYNDQGGVNWLAIQTLTAHAKKQHGTTELKFNWGSSSRTELEDEIKSGRPTILDLSRPGLQHFVVAKGILSMGSTFALNDPDLKYASDLRAYDDKFTSTRRYRPVSTDLSGILITLEAPMDLLLIDSQGRRVGVDPATRNEVNEVPGAVYFTEAALTDDGGSERSSGPGMKNLYLDMPPAGVYTILVLGGEGQAYEITFYSYDLGANPTVLSDTRMISAATLPEYAVTYDPAPGAAGKVELVTQIDVKPGSNDNPINLKSKGVIPVGILSTDVFDATTVDPLSVRFGPSGASEVHNKGHIEDVNEDGKPDLVLHFHTQQSGILTSATQACLIGRTGRGLDIRGCDIIRIVPDSR